MTYVKIGGTEYPAEINGKLADREWDGRDSKAITLTMGYSEAVALFVNGIAWSIVQRESVPTLDENGQPTGETTEQVSEFDNSDYSVAGSITDRARALRPYIEKASVNLSDEDALQAVELFPQWVTGHAYVVDERLQYKNVLYRVVQAHTSQADWTPDITPALFVVVSLDEWPEFVQPTGAHDAYKKGDKITFNGKHYISLIDANVYSPTAYPAGWQEQA